MTAFHTKRYYEQLWRSSGRGRFVMKRMQIEALLATMTLVICLESCGKREKRPSGQAVTGSADTLGTDVLSQEGFSNEAGASAGHLVLPTSFGRRTGDLDQMLKARNIRALVTINPISFFYSHGRPNGKLYDELEQLQRFVNKQFKTGKLKVRISYIPMRPDELGPALSQGVGDFVAADIVITPGRQKLYAFTTPIMRNVKQIVVTGAELAKAKSLDDLAGSDIYVSPLTSFYENLEMVSAGLIPATMAMQHRAELWGQILPNIQVHPEMMIANEGELGWVMRKDNPQLKKLLDQFTATHGQGTVFGNTLLRRYLKTPEWVSHATSAAEMKRLATYVEYFKKCAAEYNFDYLMIVAQGYQESGLDQSKKSRGGAVRSEE